MDYLATEFIYIGMHSRVQYAHSLSDWQNALVTTSILWVEYELSISFMLLNTNDHWAYKSNYIRLKELTNDSLYAFDLKELNNDSLHALDLKELNNDALCAIH